MSDARGLLFDMDGLLLDTEKVAQSAFVEVTAPYGVAKAMAAELFLHLVGGTASQTRSLLVEALPKDIDHAILDKTWTEAFVARMAEGIPIKAGIVETLGGLATTGRPMAVVTSSKTDHALDHLDRAGLLQHFVTVIGGDGVTDNKPHPAPYLTGADAIGRDPADCVAFEDSDRGVTSAIAAGCTVWQVPDLRPKDQPFPSLGQNMAKSLPEAVTAAGLL